MKSKRNWDIKNVLQTQGETDDELPEVLLSHCRIVKISLENMPLWINETKKAST
jgi:hypothetical protein